jgi:LAGLIDADG DNA endonuclease family
MTKPKKSKQKKIKEKMEKNNVRISRELRDIIHGYMISEGYMTKNACLQVDQGVDQEKFVQWMYEKLKPLCTDKGPKLVTRHDERTGKTTLSVRFYTRTLVSGFKSMWYKLETDSNGKTKSRKTLPKSIECFFSPTFVTLWYAGDGTKEPDCRAVKLEATAFTPDERLILKRLFESKFGITTHINKSGVSKTGTQQWVIRVPAEEYNKFHDVITKIDLIPTIFPYKLHKKQP